MKVSILKAALTTLGLATVLASATSFAQESDVRAGDLRAPSPRIVNWDRPGYVQVGVGPSFASGLSEGGTLYDLMASYNYNVSDSFTAKALADFNFGNGASPSRLINLGIGADAYFSEFDTAYGIPYIGADLGYGFARNEREQTRDAFTVGVGTGFKFAAQQMNFDVNLHYLLVTAQLNGQNPSIFGARIATNF